MGQYPYAHVFFGVAVGTDDPLVRVGEPDSYGFRDPLPEDEDLDTYDIGNVLAHRVGLTSPYGPAPDYDPEFSEWMESNKEWFEQRKADIEKFKEELGEIPIEIVHGGATGYGETDHGVALKGTVQSTSWDSMETLKAHEDESLRTGDFRQQLEDAVEFCEKHDIPFDDPKWMIAVSYG